MTTKTITGSYPAGYYLDPTYDTLNIKPGAYIGGTGVTTSATQASTIAVLGTVQGTLNGITLGDGGTIIVGNTANPSAIVGGVTPILVYGAPATVNNRTTIESMPVYGTGPGSYYYRDLGPSVVLLAGGTVNNAPGALITNGVVIDAAPGTVVNNGTIGGPSSFTSYYYPAGGYFAYSKAEYQTQSIAMTAGGTVVNGSGGNPAAILSNGIAITGGSGSITNNGIIGSATVTNGYYRYGPSYIAYHARSELRSIYLVDGGTIGNGSNSNRAAVIAGGIVGYGAPVTVTNNGTIYGPTRYTYLYKNSHTRTSYQAFYSIALYDGGTIINGSAINNDASITNGIYFGDAAPGTVINHGSIGYTVLARYRDSQLTSIHYGYSITLAGGGTVMNGGPTDTAAIITNGILIDGGTGTITNFASIVGSARGSIAIDLAAGGQITNGSVADNTAFIGGSFGVYLGGGTLTNFGTIAGTFGYAVYFGAPGTLIEQGSGILDGLVIGGGGTLELGNKAGPGTLTGLGGPIYDFTSVQVDKAANWTLSGPSGVELGTTLTNVGTLTMLGGIVNSGEIDNLQGAKLVLGDDSPITTDPTVKVGIFNNAGTVEKTAGTGKSIIRTGSSALTSTGKIDVETGTLELTGGTVSIRGSITGLGTVEFGPGATTLDVGSSLSTSAVLIAGTGTQVSVARNLSFGGSFSATTNTELTIDAGDLLSLAGPASFLRDTVDGAGRIATAGATSLALTVLGGTAAWSNSGTLTEIGQFTLGDSSGNVAAFNNRSGGEFDFASNAGIGLGTAAGSTFFNSGLLAKTVGNSSIIAAALVNTGTVEVVAGTIDLQNTVSGNGGILQIDAGQRLQADAAVSTSQTVDFVGAGDRLTLTDAAEFGGKLSGFDSDDKLLLTQFGAGTSLNFVENGANTAGTLTVTDGGLQAKIALLGQYAAAGFHLSVAAAGDIVTYSPPASPSLGDHLAAPSS